MVLLTAASGLYIASGYAITVWLAHHFGPGDFGRYGVVTAIVTLVNIAVARGVPVAASRSIARRPETAEETMALAVRAMLPVVLVVAVLQAVAAFPLASLLEDDRLRAPLAVGAAAALAFALQALPFAWFTGLHRYGRQAVAQTWYAVSRLAAIIGGALVAGLIGAVVGFVVAPAVAALATVGSFRMRPRRSASPAAAVTRDPSAASEVALLRASAPLVGVAALVSALLTVDLVAFKRVGTASDVGRYAAAATVAHVPFFLLRSAQLVIMPAVAAAVGATQGIVARAEPVRGEIRAGVADAIVILALPTVLLVAVGDRALDPIFGASYTVEGLVVAPLALATAAITLYTVLIAVETALGTLRFALGTGILGVALVAAAAVVGGQDSNASRAAWAVALAATTTLLVHAAFIWRRVGPFVPRRAAWAVLLACAAGAPTVAAPSSGSWLVASGVVASAAYALVALRGGLLRLR